MWSGQGDQKSEYPLKKEEKKRKKLEQFGPVREGMTLFTTFDYFRNRKHYIQDLIFKNFKNKKKEFIKK